MATPIDSCVIQMNCEEVVLPNAKLVKIPNENAYQVVPLDHEGYFEPPDASEDVPYHTHYARDITDLEEKIKELVPESQETTIDDVSGLRTELNNKAAKYHEHPVSDITGLQTALDNKSDTGHVHGWQEIDGLEEKLEGLGTKEHTHDIDDISGLQTALDSKADIEHGHDIEILNLNLDLTNVQHTHNADDIEGLEEKIKELAPGASGEITIDDVVGLQEELDGKADQDHGHEVDIVNFNLDVTQMSHIHDVNDVYGLQEQLDSKSNIDHGHEVDIVNFNLDVTQMSHTHTSADITNAIQSYEHNETITWSKDGSNTPTLELPCTEENLNIVVKVLDGEEQKENFEVQYEDIADGKMIIGDYILVYLKDTNVCLIPEFYEGTYTVTITGTLNSTSSVDYTYTCSVDQSGTDMNSSLITGKAVEDYVLSQNYAPRNHMHNVNEIFGFEDLLARISAIEAKLNQYHPE